jgi:hypothetical protein
LPKDFFLAELVSPSQKKSKTFNSIFRANAVPAIYIEEELPVPASLTIKHLPL